MQIERSLYPNAVANAMMAAQHRFMMPLIPDGLQFGAEDELKSRSRNWCREGSVTALHHLVTKYPADFNTLLLLSSERPVGSMKGFKASPFWTSHHYFLAEGGNGVWYAGSPANYRPGSEYDYMTSVILDPNLEAVLSQIRVIDGGVWPAAGFIQEQVRAQYVPPFSGVDGKGRPYLLVHNVLSRKGEDHYEEEGLYLDPAIRIPNDSEKINFGEI